MPKLLKFLLIVFLISVLFFTSTSFAFTALPQPIAQPISYHAYDRNGNLTNDGVWTHSYDYENRLISSLREERLNFIEQKSRIVIKAK